MSKKDEDPLAEAKKRGQEILKANPGLAEKLEERRKLHPITDMLKDVLENAVHSGEVTIKFHGNYIVEMTVIPNYEGMGA